MSNYKQPSSNIAPPARLLTQPLLLKTLAIAVSLLVLHSAFLWWSLSPRHQDTNSDNSLAQLRLQRGAELPKQPNGDLFVTGRERQSEDTATGEAADDTPSSAGDYALLAVHTLGRTYYAVFDNGAEQKKLTLGDLLPGVGTITYIDNRRVRTSNPDAQPQEQLFLLFPVQ